MRRSTESLSWASFFLLVTWGVVWGVEEAVRQGVVRQVRRLGG